MELSGKKVLVVGLARSGMAAIKVLTKLGAEVTLSENRKKEEIKELPELEAMGIQVEGQTVDVADHPYDLCVKNPGVPYRNNPFIDKLNENGVPIITEIELAYQVAKPQHYLAVTGSNGKTTTSTLLYDIVHKTYPEKTHLCGNIGIPLCEIVMEENLLEEEGHYIVLEISNFQLINIDRFRPDAAVILNLSPDHLDFMGTLEAYYKSKTEVYRNMNGEDVFVLNVDDNTLVEYTEKYPIHCKINRFSLTRTDVDTFVKDGSIWVNGEEVLPLSAIRVVGMHNRQNVMAAVAIAKSAGVSNEDITAAVASFHGVEHRIEFVREKDGVKYYNDSKGTNTDATITALKAFDHGVLLLVGGYEKGLPMDEVRKHLGCVKKVIGYGASGPRIVHDLVGGDGIVVKTLDEALAEANKLAAAGDTVLLSPTTSSFDQFSCFEERGDYFKKLVNAL